MFNTTKGFYILDDEDRIIILNPDRYTIDEEEAKKFDLRYRGEEHIRGVGRVFFDALMTSKYIKIPTESGFVKLSIDDNFIEKTSLLINTSLPLMCTSDGMRNEFKVGNNVSQYMANNITEEIKRRINDF